MPSLDVATGAILVYRMFDVAFAIDLAKAEETWARTVRTGSSRGRLTTTPPKAVAFGVPPVAIGLLQEASIASSVSLASLPAEKLVALINDVPIRLTGIAPIARAISSAGGVAFDELDSDFMLRRLPGVFVAGEMLDWEAPTGGYLLQACFATGLAAGKGALKWLSSQGDAPSLRGA